MKIHGFEVADEPLETPETDHPVTFGSYGRTRTTPKRRATLQWQVLDSGGVWKNYGDPVEVKEGEMVRFEPPPGAVQFSYLLAKPPEDP